MFARIMNAFNLTQDQKAVTLAYLCFTAITAGTGYFIMIQTALWPDSIAAIGLYESWMVFAAALAGGISLFIARGWIGMPGMLGGLRAFVGACVMLFLISMIAGTLILPGYGTYYAPFMVLSAFIEEPLIAMVWIGGVVVAHRLLVHATIARLALLSELEQREKSSLSPLSRTYFYHK